MRKRLWISGAFMLLLFSTAIGFRAFTADSDVVREAQDRAAGQTTPASVAAVGREVDELVKVNGQWLIKVRDVTPKE